MWWLLLLIVLIPIAWWGLQLALGAAMSPESSGRFYLRTLLKKAGVLHLVPDACVRELVAHAKQIAEFISRDQGGLALKTEMVESLQGMAAVVLEWIRPSGLPLSDSDFVPAVLAKHGVPRGATKR